MPVLNQIKNLQPEMGVLLGVLADYYNKYSVEEINHDEFVTFFYYKHPYHKDNEVYEVMLDSIGNIKITNDSLLIDILNQVVEEHTKTKISALSMESLNNPKIDLLAIQEVISSGIELIGSAKDIETNVCNDSFDSLVNTISPTDEDRDLSFRSPFMREKFGGPAPATLGHIFARPETGKTSYALFEACGFARQMEAAGSNDVIVYANNEESINRVKLRAFLAMINEPIGILREYSLLSEKRWEERGGKRIKFVGNIRHMDDIEKLLKTFKPRVLFVDQGPKLDMKLPNNKDASKAEKLQQLFNRYRELAKKHDPTSIISLGQADSLSDGKLWLTLNNLDNSKVGIPGELDWCLGIGKGYSSSDEGIRGFQVCKNKLTGNDGRRQVPFDVHKCFFGTKDEKQKEKALL